MKPATSWAALLLWLTVLTAFPALAGNDVTQAEEPPEFGLLKVAPGAENTFYTCSACHSEMIVVQQGLTRPDWEEMLEWMVEEQGMYEIEEPELSEILDYLAENYNIDRPNFPNHQLRSDRQFLAD